MKGIHFLLFGVLVFGSEASAQCPGGIPAAGNPHCIPPSAWPQNVTSSQAAPTAPRWKLTWGAIAIDPITGDVGTSVGSASKKKAEREALKDCAAKGASDCARLVFAYENQCAVIAWPSVPGARIITQGAETVELASDLALKSCIGDDADNSRGCRIVYSECTRPVLAD
ncbi:DUF4189 domain-containing protein [Lysobacter antibioticus]|uniref:DUF4189 domain-containing protein n=1 Tax=Lysobacter antibioticus TaxID=84531 RepID=UPI0009EC46C5|nr:DUF4189 domain-containing protein [Lysobacter antibioticus]